MYRSAASTPAFRRIATCAAEGRVIGFALRQFRCLLTPSRPNDSHSWAPPLSPLSKDRQMKRKTLTSTILSALLLPFVISPADAVPFRPVPLASLTAALAADATPLGADPWISAGFEGRLVWIDASELRHAEARTRVHDALGTGLPVLVTSRSDERPDDVGTFGFQADVRRAIYQRTTTGKLDVASVADELDPTEASAFFADWIERHRPRPTVHGRFAALTAAPADRDTYVPRLEITDEKRFAGGRRIAYDITITRDVRPGRDDKVIAVKSTILQVPGENGVLWNGSFREGKGYHLFMPLRYDVVTSIAPVGSSVAIRRVDMQPVGGGPFTDMVSTRLMTESGGGASVPANIIDFLTSFASGPAGALSKLPVLFPGTHKVSEEKTISMAIKDYGIVTRTPVEQGDVHQVSWSFGLDQRIATDEKRFKAGISRTGYILYSTEGFTDMMRDANLETASSWRVPGSWRGKMDITTRSTIVNRVFYDKSIDRDGFSPTMDDNGSDIHYTLRVDLDSPYLTRQPSVRIQSMQGAGQCLAQPDRSSPVIAMQTCEKGPGGLSQQWYLETDATYRNRGSDWCLTTDLDSGEMRAQACRGSLLNQQWMWSADRLHSKANGGDRWRLHLRDGVPNAKFDGALHDAIRPNRHHALLPPWWSYPEAPNAGDTAPNPNGESHLVYEEFRHHRRVSDDQRWQVNPVMGGL
ncbi:MAG: RICIN domain-containing protein [Luteibacter sp.]